MKGHLSYKSLIVYQKAERLTIDGYKYFTSNKHDRRYQSITDQSLRSVSSIGANIAEGYGRHYQKSYRQFLSIARGSCFESEYWFEIMIKLEIYDARLLKNFQDQLVEIIKMLTVLMKKPESK